MEEITHNSENPAVVDGLEDQHDEHSYDGIEELDNPPPRWIMAIFYITIGFSIIYAAYFFWLDVGDNQDARYEKKSALHDARYQMESESPDALGILTDAADLDEGKALYQQMNCWTCHGMSLEGNAIGPNLVDNATIHGCDFESVFNIIKNGVPAKGMTPFKAQLSDSKIQKVTSYIINLVGSDPANAKEPQGEICE